MFIFSNLVATEVEYKIGLGSCNNQNYPTPAWDALEEESLDAFFFLGDNVYGDVPSGELDYLKKSYELFGSVMPTWLKKTELLVIWDDHEKKNRTEITFNANQLIMNVKLRKDMMIVVLAEKAFI